MGRADERVSPLRRQELIAALRRGTVPRRDLGLLAVGLERFEEALEDELAAARRGSAVFKAVRGEYGTGKTFLSRWLQERALRQGFAAAEVQVSETETPLHRLETVYRRSMERLATADCPAGALRNVLDAWFYALEGDAAEALDEGAGPEAVEEKVGEVLESRLAPVTRTTPQFGAVLRAYRRATLAGERATAEALVGWLSGQPNVGAAAKRYAGVKGDLDHFGALSFLRGLLYVLRDAGRAGLVLVLDEVETLQRVRGDVRERGLNALRQLVDEIDAGRFPGLYLLVTGTPAFFDGPQGAQRLPPLAQRLEVDFATDSRFDNPRAVQVRLQPFAHARLVEVGRKVRRLFAEGSPEAAERIAQRCGDAWLDGFARALAGRLGERVGLAPRLFLKKLVADVLDRVDQFVDFDPGVHYALAVSEAELAETSEAPLSVDDIELPDG